ncbi:hypothetical protein ABWK50_14340 [Priestia megaterium]|uniref:hypothetical protein n=1 Tax=Priestia TaxID=2800373 RepID=UPI003390A9E6
MNRRYFLVGLILLILVFFFGNILHNIEVKWKKTKGIINVSEFDAVGDGSDETSKLQSAFSYALQNNLSIEMGVKREYAVSDQIKLELARNQKISIIGNGSTIKFIGTGKAGVTSIIEINDNSTKNLTNTIIEVSDLKFDGRGVPEQWSETTYSNIKQLWGLTLRADTIRLKNLQFKNVYGYGVKVRGFQSVSINGFQSQNVGGSWNTNDTYDAFGDSIYIGGGKQPNNTALIENVHAVGYPSDRPRKSRIGLTFEKNVEIANIKNLYIEGYNRAWHVEGSPNINLTIQNMKTRRSDLHGYVHTGYKAILINSWDAECKEGDSYGGRSGILAFDTIADTPRTFEVERGKFLIFNDLSTNFASEKVVLKDSNFVNKGGKQKIAGGHIIFKGVKSKGRALQLYKTQVEVQDFIREEY